MQCRGHSKDKGPEEGIQGTSAKPGQGKLKGLERAESAPSSCGVFKFPATHCGEPLEVSEQGSAMAKAMFWKDESGDDVSADLEGRQSLFQPLFSGSVPF